MKTRNISKRERVVAAYQFNLKVMELAESENLDFRVFVDAVQILTMFIEHELGKRNLEVVK